VKRLSNLWSFARLSFIALMIREVENIDHSTRHNPANWNLDHGNAANGLPEASTAGE
jgi:hypothetical protein